jgi:hypothetical protein
MDRLTKTGCRPSIPEDLWLEAFALYGSGLGYWQVALSGLRQPP